MNIIKFKSSSDTNDKTMGFKGAFLAALFSAAICIILLCIFSAVITYSSFGDTYIPWFANTSLFVSALIGGILSSTGKSTGGWISGLICGIMYVLIITIASGFMSKFQISGMYLLKLLAVCIISITGGVFSVNMSYKKRHKKTRA